MIGEKIQERRQKLGLTRDALAKKAAFSASQVYQWETDRQKPSADSLLELADALGVTVDWLLGRE